MLSRQKVLKVFIPVLMIFVFFSRDNALANEPPNIPSLPSPADNSTNIDPQDVVLSWTGDDPDPGDTVTYEVYFGTSGNPQLYTETGTNSISLGQLDPMKTYYWKITAKDNLDTVTEGPLWSFTTGRVVLTDVTYSVDATLTSNRGPYIVQGTMTVAENVTLTIEPGTILKFQTAASLIVNGNLDSPGESGNEVVFTSFRNDSYGGDTNGDGSATTPDRGDWAGIHVVNGSGNAVIDLRHCLIEYGAGITVAPDMQDATVKISNSVIQNNSADGIYVDGGRESTMTVELTNNQILGNGVNGIYLRSSNVGLIFNATVTGNTIANNDNHGIYNFNGHSVSSTFDIRENIIHDHPWHGIWFEDHGKGNYAIISNTIYASGTAVAITGYSSETTVDIVSNELYQGTDGIHIWTYYNGTVNSLISDNRIHDNSGIGIYCFARVFSAIIQAEIKNNLIYMNGGNGVDCRENKIDGGQVQPKVISNTIYDNSGWGIYCQSSDSVDILDNDIHGNNEGLCIELDGSSAEITNNRIYLNAGNGIELPSGGSVDILYNHIHDNGGWGINSIGAADIFYNNIHDNNGGIFIRSSGHPSVNINNIYHNGLCDIESDGGGMIMATSNYWGPETTAEMELEGEPSHISAICAQFGMVYYAYWLTEPIETADGDGDGLLDLWEHSNGLDHHVRDTDADGLEDGDEKAYWGANWNSDYDGDGKINIRDPDADNDGALDGAELNQGYDPQDASSTPITVYEDAQDGLTDGWYIYDNKPAGAAIRNVYESGRDNGRGSRVIELSGYIDHNGFRLDRADGTPWRNPGQFIIRWSMKFSEYFVVYVELETTAGSRFMRYEPRDFDKLGVGEYVHCGLGSGVYDGQWHTLVRDLQADLQMAQPGVNILEVNAFLIRGSGRLDDIQLMDQDWDGDADGITDFEEANTYGTDLQQSDSDQDGIDDGEEILVYGTNPIVLDTDQDGLNDGDELNFWGTDWSTDIDSDGLQVLLDEDADNDGALDGAEVDQGYDPQDAASTPATIYEDAQDGTIDGWHVYDNKPAGAAISNVYDTDRDSRVIELSGYIDHNGFRLDRADGSPWGNSGQFTIRWSLKFSEYFVVYVELETTAGRRFMRYEPRDFDKLGVGEYVHCGLGSGIYDGQWHTLVRDLQADLQMAQPGVVILEVNAFLIRGSGRLDDIQLMDQDWDGDADGITDFEEANTYGTDLQQSDSDQDGIDDGEEISVYGTNPTMLDSDQDGLNDGDELNFWGTDWSTDIDSDGLQVLLDEDADNDGAFDGAEVNQGYDPQDASSTPVSVYEDAEDGTTDGWHIYDNKPAGAVISNVYDTDRDSRVIELSGYIDHNGFRLDRADGTPWSNPGQFTIQWSLRFSEYFVVYVELETTDGRRFMRYEPRDFDKLGVGEYVHCGLGSGIYDDQWHTLVRDLQADLQLAQPGVNILEVNAFLIRGSGRVDDIQLK